jgi:hypothetical protein
MTALSRLVTSPDRQPHLMPARRTSKDANFGVASLCQALGARNFHFVPASARRHFSRADLPPLKWSSLKYDFRMEDKINGKEEAYG